MNDLKDRIALVTGASSGIGAGIVKELLQSGMKVVGLARRKERIEELGKGFEGKLFAVQADVSKEDDIIRAFKWTEENVGPIYALINNAGVLHFSSIDEAQPEHLRHMLEINLLALTLFTREGVRTMKANNVDGVIININSLVGHCISPHPGMSVYTATKHGVTAFTESIRAELATAGSKIRITSLSPGLVASEMTSHMLDQYPYIESEDIGRGVVYVLSQPKGVNVAELTLRPTGGTL